MLIDAVVNIASYWRHPTNLIALEFGVVSFSFTTIHNIFMLYFVDLFLFHYGLKLSWLYISQICFLFWNFTSHYFLGNPKQSSKYEMTVTYGGPVLAVVFLFPFVFQFSTMDIFIGIYFTVFLCLYDTIFNWVLLSRSIWLQENVVNLKDKLKIHFLGFIFASVASSAVFPSYWYYPQRDPNDYNARGGFRWFCLIISLLSFAGFIFSSFCHILREGDKSLLSKSSSPSLSSSSPLSPSLSPSPSPSSSSSLSPSPLSSSSSSSFNYSKYKNNTALPQTETDSIKLGNLLRNVSQHRNMLIYIFVNILQVFSSTFSVVFLHLFITHHVRTSIGWQAGILFICFFSPVLMNIALSLIANKKDSYELLKQLFQVKIGISLFALFFGQHLFVAALFTVFSRAVVESVFGLLMFVNQHVDNEHHVKFGYRKASQRLVALGKIGQAAAPIVGVVTFTSEYSSDHYVINNSSLFYSSILVMLLSGFMQLYLWSKYTLRGSYLKDIEIMAKGKLSSDNTENFSRGYNNNNNNYNNYFDTPQKDNNNNNNNNNSNNNGEKNEIGIETMRKKFGETLFNDNNPNSPNLSNMATISHKQVISSVV